MLRWPIVLAMLILIFGIVGFGPLGANFSFIFKALLLLCVIGFGASIGVVKRGSSIV